MTSTGIDEAKLEAFMGQAVTDMGAIISAPLMVIGEKLGLYRAMAGAGPPSHAGGMTETDPVPGLPGDPVDRIDQNDA